MKNILSPIHLVFLKKAVMLFTVFSFIIAPLSPLFAEEIISDQQPESTVISDIPLSDSTNETPTEEAINTPPPIPSEEEITSQDQKKIDDEKLLALNSVITPIRSLTEVGDVNKNRLSPEIDSTTGALVYKYNIEVPPGRNEITPDLSLIYNSANATRDSIVGSGWDINIPYIERINKHGSNYLYSDNYYVSSLDGELVSLGNGVYASRDENGEFLKYELSNDVWTVTDKKGTIYKFGTTADSRQDNPSDNTKIFKWMLEESRDTNNNYIKYEYFKDAGQIYPSKITYTGNGTTPGVLEVNFVRESRTSAPAFYNTGFSVKSNYRINEIRTEVSDVWARKYTLAYTTGDNLSGSLLDTIVESGQDDSSTVTTLPETNFSYATSATDWTYNSSLTMPLLFINGSTDYGMRTADINGDGLVDIICHNDMSSGTCNSSNPEIYMHTTSGWTNVNSTWSFPNKVDNPNQKESFISSVGKDTGLRAVDVNGDLKVDLVRGNGSSTRYVYINNGSSGWTYDSSWSLPLSGFLNNGTDYGFRMGDINGDGLPDILCHTESSGACDPGEPKIYLNNGSGWTNVSSTWLFPTKADDASKKEAFLGSTGQDLGLRLFDVNGDGLADLVRGKGNAKYIYLNTGSSWVYTSSWSFPLQGFINSSAQDYGLRMVDMNGDNLPDVICHNESSNGNCSDSNPEILLNTGSGWTNVNSTWVFPNKVDYPTKLEAFLGNTLQDIGLRVLDVNGDGLDDLVRGGGPTTNKYSYLNNEDTQSNLLSGITYPQGGATTITYKATSLFKDASNQLLNPAMPIIFDVVSQISTSDNIGTNIVNDYEYQGGEYYFNNYLNRKFAGFSKIIKTDSMGNKTINYYHQGNGTNSANGEYDDHISKIGKIYRTELTDSSGNIYSKTINKWDKYNIGTDHNFVKLVQTIDLTYDGDSDHKDKATTYTYNDTNGNVTEKIDWGEVTGTDAGTFTDTGTDKSTTSISYASNTGANIIGLPSQETTIDQNSNKVNENKYYYDNQSLGNVTDGNQTKVEMWKDGTNYVNTQKTYNTTYGIPTSSTDENGKVTSYSYDTYNLYPTTITDPLSHSTSYVYDYSIGKPKQTTDQNNFIYQTIYDGLDRIIEEKIPGFSSPYTPVTKTTYTYTDTSGSVKIQKTDYLDSSSSRDIYQYFDGIGRLIQERKEAEISGDFNARDIVYNNRGLVLKESIPYTSSGSSKTSSTSTSSLYANYTYDTSGRPLTVINALGTTSYAYDDWKTTITDAENNVKNYYKDAYNNLVRVDEINGASTYTTNYEWNLNNKLTKITDALSNIRNFTYDGLGRRLTAQDLHTSGDSTFGTWTYVYDNAGNITQTVSPNSLTTNYTYNDINQQLTEDTTGVIGTEITYTYGGCTNGVNRLCSVSMTSGVNSSYTYDSNGNVTSEQKTINSTPYTTSYTYDRQGNKLVITYPDNAEVRYTFNTAGLLEKIERKESGGSYTDAISNLDYSSANQITTQTYPNTVTTTNTYDATKMYRLTRRLTQNTVPIKLQDLNYTYDNVNNITQIVDASDTDSSKTVTYTYDDLNRLLSATATNVASGQSTYTHTFTYNAIGNITSSPVGSYTYASTDYANPHAATSINSVTNTYDNDGNVLTDGTLTNTWSYKDQLATSTNGTFTRTYLYDESGNRVSSSDGTTTTVYPNKFYNYDGAKKTKSIYAGDQLVATIETVGAVVTPYYDHIDQLNSVVAVSNSSGGLSEILDYYPYGNQRISSGSYNSQRRALGQMYDTDTMLNYYQARYQNGVQGRFISEDPSFLAIGDEQKIKNVTGLKLTDVLMDPQSYGSYSYARNNPIKLSDPQGKWFGEFLSGQQSSDDFSREVGVASQYMYSNSSSWKFSMDHPVATGAIVGLASFPAVSSAGTAIGAFQMATYSGVGTSFAVQQAVAGTVYSSLSLASTLSIPNIVSNFGKVDSNNTSSFYKAGLSLTKEIGPSIIGGYVGAISDAIQIGGKIGNTVTNFVTKIFSLGSTQKSTINNKSKIKNKKYE